MFLEFEYVEFILILYTDQDFNEIEEVIQEFEKMELEIGLLHYSPGRYLIRRDHTEPY